MPDLAAVPALFAHAYRLFDSDEPVFERIHVPEDVVGAEASATEGANDALGCRAIVESAEADAVSLLDSAAIDEMAGEVVMLEDAFLARADSVVSLYKVAVVGAEGTSTVLALKRRLVVTSCEPSAKLAEGLSHKLALVSI